MERLEDFRAILMWTLTIDPELFPTPGLAYQYCREKRAVSELVRALDKQGHLLSRRYFYVVEWQEVTEMPHWHLLLESRRVPFDSVCTIWNRNRPKAAGPAVGDRPGFGSVRFSKRRFADHIHAARYATKYLIKFPDSGYPDWVRDWPNRICRFRASRGFWGGTTTSPKTDKGKKPEDAEKKKRNCHATIRERTAACDKKAIIAKLETFVDADGKLEQGFRYVDDASMPFAECKAFLNPDGPLVGRRVNLEPHQAAKLSTRSVHAVRNIDPERGFSSPDQERSKHEPRKAA